MFELLHGADFPFPEACLTFSHSSLTFLISQKLFELVVMIAVLILSAIALAASNLPLRINWFFLRSISSPTMKMTSTIRSWRHRRWNDVHDTIVTSPTMEWRRQYDRDVTDEEKTSTLRRRRRWNDVDKKIVTSPTMKWRRQNDVAADEMTSTTRSWRHRRWNDVHNAIVTSPTM